MTDYTVGMNYMMDTHQAVKELVSRGVAEEQAEAIVSFQVRFFNENVATKQDIALIQYDIAQIRHDIEAQRLATQKDIEGIRKDMQVLSSQLTLRMCGMLVLAVGFLASLVTFMG